MTMFIACSQEKGFVEQIGLRPIDRSTVIAGDPRAPGAAAARFLRRMLLAGLVLLLAACSSLQLGYNNVDLLLGYTLDSYLDLNNEQQKLARDGIARLHRWHRSTQLAGYSRLLKEATQKAAGPLAVADVREFNAEVNRKLGVVGEQVAGDLARLALTLQPAQVDRLAERLARDTSKARRELIRFAGAESLEQRVERAADRAESWLGRLSPAQHEMIRASIARRPDAHEAWLQERERRQRELVAVVSRIRTEQPSAETAATWMRDYFAQLAEPRDPERRARLAQMRADNAELIAQLVNGATPAQREHLARKLRGYAADFEALAAKATTGSG
jgi:hypothetical protein